MEITKKRLKEIIKEEMVMLADSGELMELTESEREVFEILLEKLTPEQLEDFGLKKI